MSVKVRKHKKGWIEVDIRVRLADGSEVRERKKAPCTSKTAALRWGEERQSFLVRQGVKPQKREVPTLASFEERFIRDHVEANRQKPSSVEAKKSIFKNHLVPAFGTMRLDEITTPLVQQLKGSLQDRRPKTVNNVLNALSVVLRTALKWGVIDRLPCHIEMLKSAATEMAFYDFEEHERLVAAAGEIDARIHLLVLLGCDAGLRCGEMLALEWADIDLQRRVITVSRSEWRRQVTLPKGGRSRRVPMTAALTAGLEKHVRKLNEARVLWRNDGLDMFGRPLLRKWLSRAQRLAKLADTGALHILRHTFCSHLAMQGVPVNAIKELAGHQDIKTTMRYLHLSPAAKDSAVAALDRRPATEMKFGDSLETKKAPELSARTP